VFELGTGEELGASELSASSRTRIVHAAEGLLVLHDELEYRLEGIELPVGKGRWRLDLQGHRGLLPPRWAAAGIVLLGSRPGLDGAAHETFIALVDPATGRMVRAREGLRIGVPGFLEASGEAAYVASREADGGLAVRAFALSDLSASWAVDVGGRDTTLMPGGFSLARDHVVLTAFEGDPQRKFGYRATLLDNRGTVVQNILSDSRFEGPPSGALGDRSIVFSADNRVEAYR
jgi:hypothetical protein